MPRDETEHNDGPTADDHGNSVSVPESMPDRYRPDTPGSNLHVYGQRGDAEEMLSKLGHVDGIKTVKRDGRVEFHLTHKESHNERGCRVRTEVTCECPAEDFE